MNDCPYVGLVPFEKNHARYFFGRGEDIKRIIANLSAHRLTLLYGPSGVGKSSVLNAGVIAAIDDENIAVRNRGEVPDWELVAFRNWQFSPAAGLARVLAKGCTANVPDLRVCHDSSVHELLLDYFFVDSSGACAHERENVPDLLIILDQFEEFFLYHGESAEGRVFLNEIVASIMDRRLRAGFMISMRDDSLAKLDVFKSRIPFLFDNRLSLGPLTEAGARDAIVSPLAVFNVDHRLNGGASWTIEAALVDQVISEVRDGKLILGDAPMGDARLREEKSRTTSSVDAACLQMVVSCLWTHEKSSKSTTLRVTTFKRLGRSKGIIGSHLDRILNGPSFSDKDRRITALVSRHLVTSSNSKVAHGAQALAELTGLDSGAVRPVLDKLAKPTARILRTVQSPGVGQEPRYEIFHDLLGRAVIDWRKGYFDKQRARRMLATVATSVALVIGFASLAYYFKYLSDRALTAEQEATKREIDAVASSQEAEAAQRDAIAAKETAMELERRSNELARRSAESENLLAAAIQERERVVAELTKTVTKGAAAEARTKELEEFFEKVKSTLASKPKETAQLEGAGPKLIRLGGHAGSIWQGAFSSNGRHFATACQDGQLRVWRTRNEEGELLAKPATILTQHVAGESNKSGVYRVAFNPAGDLIAAAAANEPVRIFRIDEEEGNRQLATFPVGSNLTEMVFMPRANQPPVLVTATQLDGAPDWNVQGWKLDRDTSGNIQVLPSYETKRPTFVSEIAFSRNGKYAMVSAHNGENAPAVNLVVLDLSLSGSDPVIAFSQTFGAPTRKMLFSPDPSSTVIGGGMGRQVLIADFKKTQAKPSLLSGHQAAVWDVAFSPDGKTLASVAPDGRCLLWDVGSRSQKAEVSAKVRGRIFSVAWSTQNILALGGEDGWLWMWRMRKDGLPGTSFSFPGHTGPIWGVKFSPDGRQLASWTRTLPDGFVPTATAHAAETGGDLSQAADSNAILWDVDNLMPPPLAIVLRALRATGMDPESVRPDSDIRTWFSTIEAEDIKLGMPAPRRSGQFVLKLKGELGEIPVSARDLLSGRIPTPQALVNLVP